MKIGSSARRCLALLVGLTVLAAPHAAGAAEADAQRRTITVVGVGRERGAPDTAALRFGVEHTAPSAAAASQAAAKSATHVIEALRKEVGDDGRVETAGFQLNPVYRQQPERGVGRERGPEITGYTAVNEVTVETRRVASVGAMIDAAIAAGAARVNSLAFTIAEPAPLQARALKAAGADAAAQAAAIAAALNLRLKDVLEASTDAAVRPQPQRYGAMRAEAALAPTPIEPGEVTTEARLRVTYGVE